MPEQDPIAQRIAEIEEKWKPHYSHCSCDYAPTDISWLITQLREARKQRAMFELAAEVDGNRACEVDARNGELVTALRKAEQERDQASAECMEGHRAFAELFGERMNGRDFAVKVTMAKHEIVQLKQERDEARRAIEKILTAGNHLASFLINALGAGEDQFPLYGTETDKAYEKIADPNLVDAWICWREIMLVRDAMLAHKAEPDVLE